MLIYSDPNGLKSSVDVGDDSVLLADSGKYAGEQFNLFKWQRKAVIAMRDKMIFQQMAGTDIMPKHYGKEMKVYEYIPVLDDRNVNDQGLDALGATITVDKSHAFLADNTLVPDATITGNATGFNTVALCQAATGFDPTVHTASQPGTSLYGGSNDVGTIAKRMPALTEEGGMVNRIGYSRNTIVGSIENQGFFMTYTEDSMQFDTDSELLDHIMTENLVAANTLIEDNVQLDLLANAGVEMFAGGVTTIATITPEGVGVENDCLVSYKDLLKMNVTLDDNHCPKSTRMITGSRMIDTKVVNAARYCYVGSEMTLTLESMEDLHQNPAWKSVETYAKAGNVAANEIGAVGRTRFVVADRMMRYAGGGGVVGTNTGFAETTVSDGAGATEVRYDVAPMLFVGSGSFSTITFNTSGKSVKFSIIHKKPGPESADAHHDPFGKKGFSSIQYWYGSLFRRPEWIGIIYTAIAE